MSTSSTTGETDIRTRCITRLVRFFFVLTVIFCAPEIHASFQAAAATDQSVVLSWTAPGDDGDSGMCAQFDIRYATVPLTEANWDQAQQVVNEPTPEAAGTVQSHTIEGLNSSTTYYFAIKAADEVPNWSAMSNVVSITTQAETEPPATVTNLNVVLPTRNSLTLVWSAPGDDSLTGTATQYDIRYSTSPITNETAFNNATQVDNEPTPSAAGEPDSMTITGLAEATTYYFAMKTADEVPNWSGMSNVPFGTTASDNVAPSAINDLEAVPGPEQGSIDLSWTAPGDDGFSGSAALYEIRYAYDSITEANWNAASVWNAPPAPFPSGSPQSTVLTGLDPGAVYYIGVKAYDDAANSSSLSNVDSAVAFYDLSLDADEENDNLPESFSLQQNYPNPFNPSTEIHLTIPTATRARLVVYNSAGREVATLLDGDLAAGEHTVTWNGSDHAGGQVATGVYYYRLAAGDYVETKKMMLLK